MILGDFSRCAAPLNKALQEKVENTIVDVDVSKATLGKRKREDHEQMQGGEIKKTVAESVVQPASDSTSASVSSEEVPEDAQLEEQPEKESEDESEEEPDEDSKEESEEEQEKEKSTADEKTATESVEQVASVSNLGDLRLELSPANGAMGWHENDSLVLELPPVVGKKGWYEENNCIHGETASCKYKWDRVEKVLHCSRKKGKALDAKDRLFVLQVFEKDDTLVLVQNFLADSFCRRWSLEFIGNGTCSEGMSEKTFSFAR